MLFDHGNCRSLNEALMWAQEARRAGLLGSYPSACVVLEKYAVALHGALKAFVRLDDDGALTLAADQAESHHTDLVLALSNARELLKA